jgi:DNA repair protein RecO (recombination protein O)
MPRPERIYRSEAVILRRHEYGEADRLLTLFTPDQGKIRVLAKGVRKQNAKMAGHLELFTQVQMHIRRGDGLHVVSQAEQITAFFAQQKSLPWFAYASYLVELLDRLCEFDEPNPPVYALLVAALAWLSQPEADPMLVARYYELRLLHLTGFQVTLHRCAIGGEPLAETDQFFSPSEGGVVCPAHREGQRGWPLPLNIFKILRFWARASFAETQQHPINMATHLQIERLLHEYIGYILEQRLESIAFIDILRQTRGS